MIPAGRTVIDTYGIAVLHGMSPHEAASRRPWDKRGHPEPLTSARSNVIRSPLWDERQAVAFAAGTPVPALPGEDNCEDLLDVVDVAERLDVSVTMWMAFERYEEQHDRPKGRMPIVPPPDRVVYGHRHWFRRTVDLYATAPAPERTAWDDMVGDSQHRGDMNLLVRRLLDHIGSEGERMAWVEIAREIDRCYFRQRSAPATRQPDWLSRRWYSGAVSRRSL